jgi:SAM-dependent methyltransferase
MLQVAHERVPTAQFDRGDMRQLPYDAESFDAVTFFNSLQFCTNSDAALAEARRVTRPGGTVFIALFGREEHVELRAKWRSLAALLPRTAQTGPDPMALSGPGVLDELVLRSGLRVNAAGYVNGSFEYPDEATMLRAQRATMLAVVAERAVGEAVVNDTILRAYAPYRTSSGGYRLEVEWRYIQAEK